MKFYTRPKRSPQVIIVALIDIFVILLIFTVMTMKFKQAQPEVTIKLPESKSAAAAEAPSAHVVLSITENEEFYLDARRIEITQLKDEVLALLRQNPPPSLALNADRKAPFGVIIRVLDELKAAGVKGSLSAFTDPAK